MKRSVKCFLVMIAICILMTSLIATASLAESSKYGMVIGDGRVNVRQSASKTAKAWFQLEPGTVVTVTGTNVVNGDLWYNVEAVKPGTNDSYTGAILGEYFSMLTDEEEAAYLKENKNQNQEQKQNQNQKSSNGVYYGYINRGGGTNFRKQAKLSAPTWDRLVKRTVVEVLDIPEVVTNNSWYKVRYDGHVGYIMAQYVTLTTDADLIKAAGSGSITTTGKHVELTKTSCHLRTSPEGSYDLDWENPGETLPVAGTAVKKGKYTWYPVSYNDSLYYVRSDCVRLVD